MTARRGRQEEEQAQDERNPAEEGEGNEETHG